MKQFRPFLFLLLLLIPLAVLHAAQTTPVPHLEITGVNASQMPTTTVTANVYDTLGQPVLGLTTSDFTLTGDLSGVAQISKVENISDNNLPFAVVLAIDVSTSMSGTPFANAKQAAHAFIENIGANDPVAILTFGSQVKVVQDYTTDKSVLSSVIDNLPVGGETALYQGADEAVQLAADSPTPRRAVIMLSDGAEYGSISHVGRSAAADDSLKDGVPVYTIGVGFGVDRSYLDQLSNSTNAKNYESPTSTELTQIYTDLAAKLRSQYVVTLNVPLPLDGTQYNLGLEVKTAQGTADATAVLRAPIPVPIVRLPDQKDPIAQSTEITATILHDDPLKSVTFQVNGRAAVTATTEPYIFTVNPVDYPPGSYILTVSATDTNSDTGTGTLNFTVAPLPSEISLTPDLAPLGAIAKAQVVTVNTSGQTDAPAVSVDFNHSGQPTDLTAPYSFTIDPLFFVPGDNSVTISVTNAGGVTSSQTFPFTVAPLPPQITIVGLQDGQSISAPVKFTIQTTSQEDITQITAKAGSTSLQPASDGSFTIDPMAFAPGATSLTISATTVSGRSGSAQVNFIVAPLPPQIIVHGLTAGDTLTADRDVTLDFVTQSPVIYVAFFVDGQDLAHEVHAPYGVKLGVLDYPASDHNLRLIADDADGQSSTLDIPFTIAPEPAVTATAVALLATQNAVASATQQAVQTSLAVTATQGAYATATQVAQVSATAAAVGASNTHATAVAVTATQVAQASATQAARAGQASATQQAALNLQTTATDNARATQLANNLATIQAQVSATAQAAQATATAVQATQAVQATATNQAQATATEQQIVLLATGNAVSTQQQAASEGTGTAVAQAALQATANGVSTQTAIQQATETSQVIIQAMLATQSALQANATATRAANATQSAQATASLVAQATQSAQATATQLAGATATEVAQVTVAAQATLRSAAVAQMQAATRDTLSTANAQARLSAQATQDTRATRSAAATSTAQANLTATAIQATQVAVIATSTQLVVAATQTQSAPLTVTAAAQQTLSALEATATQIVIEATATRHALETQAFSNNGTATQLVSEATATSGARATAAAQETLSVVATANRSAQFTATALEFELGGTATRQVEGATATQMIIEATATQASLDATATTNAQATIDTRLTAVGPTATPLNGGAQNAGTPQPIPTLTEIQAQEPPASANLAPIGIVVIVIIVLIVVLVLIMRGRGAPKR